MSEIIIPVQVVIDEEAIRAAYADFCLETRVRGDAGESYEAFRGEWVRFTLSELEGEGHRIERMAP